MQANRGTRTQRLGEEILDYLTGKGMATDIATQGARSIATVFGKPKDLKDKNPTHIEQLASVSPEERKAALALADRLLAGQTLPAESKNLVPEVLRQADTATDIAMFGRMLADNPDYNREAAVQVAHAITTHRVEVEDDFYTAVDDLKKPSEDAGAGFIGELGFGSGVFYLYACMDCDLLEKNLGGDKSLAAIAIAALVEGLDHIVADWQAGQLRQPRAGQLHANRKRQPATAQSRRRVPCPRAGRKPVARFHREV